MKKALIITALAALVLPSDAHAQMQWTDQGFFNVNFGFQTGSRSLNTTTTFDIYEETGSVSSTQDVEGGPLFDVSGGYKVWRNLALGVGYSRVSSSSGLSLTGSIPDPVFFDRPRPVTATAGDAEHTEQAIHLQGVWMVPVTDTFDVGVGFGPTIFMIKQDIPTALSVSEPGPTVSSVTVSDVSKTTVGFHAGVDMTYLVTRRAGIGVNARYVWGSADLEGTDDSLTLGGFQIGGGVRIRF